MKSENSLLQNLILRVVALQARRPMLFIVLALLSLVPSVWAVNGLERRSPSASSCRTTSRAWSSYVG